MNDEELAEIEKEVASWIFSRRTVGERLIAEVRRLKGENENLAGELRDEKAYAKELRDNFGEAGIY